MDRHAVFARQMLRGQRRAKPLGPPARCTSRAPAPTRAPVRPRAAHDSTRPPRSDAAVPSRLPPDTAAPNASPGDSSRPASSPPILTLRVPAFTRLNTSTRLNSRALIHVLPSDDPLRGHQLRGHFYFAREGTFDLASADQSPRPTPAPARSDRLFSGRYVVSRNTFAASPPPCPVAAISSRGDPDACRDCARPGPWLAASCAAMI